MTTTTSIHFGSTPTAPPEIEGPIEGPGGLQLRPLEQSRPSTPPVTGVGGSPSPWSRERERPEDDEAVVTAVLAAATRRAFGERPEDDEVILTYTSEPACRRMR
ncbi:hypothetical protein AVL61_14170 [Kocuria rosea subsp. polaris]|uniref:Uncharacterized protein n=1 Tax=Kocuria rosea subsp. polaris TaxID=136273 RepID=A0A0W8IBJ6_KOCRO|nr:hypothetical protein [Kocuria polaris]KUG57272.1 hypothetical protein AVL61_14170 [Kocuria polaris]